LKHCHADSHWLIQTLLPEMPELPSKEQAIMPQLCEQ